MGQSKLILLLLAIPLGMTAQKPLPPEFLNRLMEVGAEMLIPLDGGYKGEEGEKNPYCSWDYALRSRLERLEIRYVVRPDTADSRRSPAIDAHRMALNLCSNDEDAVMTARNLTEEELYDLYNADWGRVYNFPPKLFFSASRYCQMLAMYKAGRGLIFVFLLFDEPTPEIEHRLYAMRFL